MERSLFPIYIYNKAFSIEKKTGRQKLFVPVSVLRIPAASLQETKKLHRERSSHKRRRL